MKLGTVTKFLPTWQNALLAVLAAVLLILAFPDFEFWFLAWFALVPLLWAVERERRHSCRHEGEAFEGSSNSQNVARPAGSWGQECPRSFLLGWIFGNIFFFGTCWWLTYAPINYAAFPPALAYFLLFCVTSVAAVFPGLFAAILSVLLRRFGSIAFLAAPFVWVFTEFLRYWFTGNNWNALGYSQALGGWALNWASFSGIYGVSFSIVLIASLAFLLSSVALHLVNNKEFRDSFKSDDTAPPISPFHFWPVLFRQSGSSTSSNAEPSRTPVAFLILFPVAGLAVYYLFILITQGVPTTTLTSAGEQSLVVAVQANVPMAGLSQGKWETLRHQHVQLAEQALATLPTENRPPTTVVFPESPMNFAWNDDLEFQIFIRGFARRNNISVLFNSAEPDPANGKFYNSAVMIDPQGREVQQYDKIYLLPFGEAVPFPLDGIMPGFVGSFSYGQEYDLFPLGDAKAGVMICFESHFGQLSREFVRNGADVIIEMTNDGYLGPTPVLRQHLANAVFRAVETNRPVLRVTNVGITAYINERGEVLDAAPTYEEATRVWSVAKSDGYQTLYVRYGDWFAWLCSIVTVGLLVFAFFQRKRPDENISANSA